MGEARVRTRAAHDEPQLARGAFAGIGLSIRTFIGTPFTNALASAAPARPMLGGAGGAVRQALLAGPVRGRPPAAVATNLSTAVTRMLSRAAMRQRTEHTSNFPAPIKRN